MMPLNQSVYECRLCMTLTWSNLNPPCIILYSQWAACRWWSVCSCCDKQEVRCRLSLNLSRLRYGCQRCTLAVAKHCPALAIIAMQVHEDIQFSGKYLNVHLKFTVYGRKQAWSVGRIHTHLHNAVPLVWGSLRLAPLTYLVYSENYLVCLLITTRTQSDWRICQGHTQQESKAVGIVTALIFRKP